MVNIGAVPMVMLMVSLATLPDAFSALTANLYVPVAVGVPVSAPLDESESPVGSVPDETENVGAGVPVAVNWYETAAPGMAHMGGVSATNVGAVPTV